jgi:hypothetical protein
MSAQEAARDPALAGAHVVATARALAPPAAAFELITPLVGSGGLAVVFHGETADLPPDAASWEPGIATIEVAVRPSLPREELED